MKNVGTIDRIIRFVIGVFLLSVPYFYGYGDDLTIDTLSFIGGIIGLSLILSAALGMCLVYRKLGINTCGFD